jgi:hypothetical protein
MTRNQDLGPGGIILFVITALVGGVSALKLIGPNSPTHEATTTSGTLQADLLVYPLVVGLPAAAVIALLGWWYYG